MNLVILGATGKTGRHLVEQALAAGHTVTAVVRNSAKLGLSDPKLKIVVGDVRDSSSLSPTLKGQDAVISALGSLKMRNDLMADTTRALITAAHATNVKRVIMMSSFLAAPRPQLSSPVKVVSSLLKGVVADKTAAETLLRQSGLEWTIVYATALTDAAPTGRWQVIGEGGKAGLSHRISRADTAAFILAQLTSPAHSYQSPIIAAQ